MIGIVNETLHHGHLSYRSVGDERDQLKELVAAISGEQRTILLSSFQELEEDPEKNGLGIFFRMFQDYPDLKTLWPKFKFIPDSSLQNAAELQSFAIVYMNGLRSIVENFDDNDKLADLLEKISRTHQVKGIKRHHLQKMLPMLLETLRAWRGGKPVDKKTQEAWGKLFDVIATIIEIYNSHSHSHMHGNCPRKSFST